MKCPEQANLQRWKRLSGAGALRGGRWQMTSNEHRASLGDNENVLNVVSWWLHNSVNTLKTTELYTLNGWIVWYVNDSSIKLLEKSALCKIVNVKKSHYTHAHHSLLLPYANNHFVILHPSRGVIEMWDLAPFLSQNMHCSTTFLLSLNMSLEIFPH